jgi:hypothetical protein
MSGSFLCDGVNYGVKTPELSFVDQPILVDPGGQRLKGCRVQVHWSALCVSRARDQVRLLEDLNVFGDSLFGDRERLGERVDGGWAPAEPGDHCAAHRVSQGHEGSVEIFVYLCVGWRDNHLLDQSFG